MLPRWVIDDAGNFESATVYAYIAVPQEKSIKELEPPPNGVCSGSNYV